MPAEYKNLIKHSFIYGAGNILGRGLAFLLIPLYTYYLTPAEYGILSLIELTSYVAAMFLGFGLTQSMLRFYYEDDDLRARNQIVSSSLVLSLIITSIGSIPMFFYAEKLSSIVFQTAQYSKYFKLLVLGLFLGLLGDVPLTYLRLKEKSFLYSASLLARTVLSLSLNIIFIVVFHLGVMGILISTAITMGLNTAVLFYSTFREVKISISIDKIREMIKYGLPFIPGGLGMFILNWSDRFFLQRYSTLSDVGIYSLGYKFGMILQFLVFDPFFLIWGPKRFEFANEKHGAEKMAKVITYFSLIYLFGGLGLSILIKDIFRIFVGPEYRVAHTIVPVVVIAYFFLAAYFLTQIGILVEKKTKYIALIVGVCAAAKIILCWLLVPAYQSMGAAVATLCSFGLMFLIGFIAANRLYPIPIEYNRIGKMVFLSFGLFAIGTLFEAESLILSLGMKVLILSSFPFLLYLFNFFDENEVKTVKQQIRRGWVKIKIPFWTVKGNGRI